MPVFLAFLEGGLFVAVASNTTKNNINVVKEDIDNILDDRRELMRKVDEILKEKEKNGEIKMNR
jgi:hypothetical protein